MDLRSFMKRVDELGELLVIEGADWDSEIGAACFLAAKQSPPPGVIFVKVKGYPAGYRIFANPYSNDKRAALTLGLPIEASGLELVRKIRDKISKPVELIPSTMVKSGPVTENVLAGDDVDLFKFPTPKWQPLDGGRYIGTGCTVIAKDLEEGWINVSTQRVQIHDKSTVTVFTEPGRHLDMIRKKYWAKGQSCPAVITCGSHPAFVFVGGMRIPWGVCEYDYLGWFVGESIEVIAGPTTGLPIPSHAEIALEGEMLPPEVESRIEGPFSEWTGHYSPARPEAAFKVRAILHRDDPIILAVLPFLGPEGRSRSPFDMVKEAQVWNMLDMSVPGVKGVCTHREFGGMLVMVISIEQKYAGHAKQVALLALGQMSYFTKFVIIVDDDIDPSNLSQVLWAVGLRSYPEEYDVIRNTLAGNLDPSVSPLKRELGDLTRSGLIILACRPFHWIKDYPIPVVPDPMMEKKIKAKWKDLA